MSQGKNQEPIRKWPVPIARLANRIIGWTDQSCAGNCKRPVTGKFEVEIDKVNGIPVYLVLCSLGGKCEEAAISDAQDNYPYARRDLVKALELNDVADPIKMFKLGG